MNFKQMGVIFFTAFVATTLMGASQLGRNSEITWPDLGDPAGSSQVDTIQSAITNLSDDDNSRFRTASGIADSTLTAFVHDFGVAFSELNVLLYTGTHPALTRVPDPAASGWTIVATGASPLISIDVTTPGSGGPHTFALQIIQGRGAEKLNDLDDVDVASTPPEDNQALVFDSGGSVWIPGSSGDSSFKCQTVSDPDLTLKSGFLILDGGVELQIAADLTVSLDTILGSDPVDATTYYLYLDLDSIPAATLLSNGRQVRIVSATGHFSLQTALPDTVLQSQFVPICLLKSASAGTVWSGAGSDFATLATRRHGRPTVNVSPTIFELSKQTVGAVGSSGQVMAGHELDSLSFPSFTTETSFYNLGDVSDDSGNARTLTQTGDGVFTGAAIDGSSSTYDQDGTGDNLQSTAAFFNGGDADFTAGCWVKVDTFAAGDFFFGTFGTTLDSWQMVQSGTDEIDIKGSTGSVNSVLATITTGLLTDYNHWAVRYEASSNEFNVYVNGILDTVVNNGGALDAATGTVNYSIGGAPAGAASTDGKFDECFFTTQFLSDAEIRKAYSYRIDRTDSVIEENQAWYGTFFDANDELINELDQDWLISKTTTDAYIDLGLDAADSVALRMQNQSFNTTVVPIKTFSTGLQSSDPGTQTHALSCIPKDFYVITEGTSLSGDFDKRYDLCSADDTSITCDLSSLTIDGTHRVEIVGSCVPIAVSVPSADATTAGIITTGTQTIAGAKTFTGLTDFTTGISFSGGDTLSVYDEGTWTATESSKGNLTGTSVFNDAEFVRIGKKVFATIDSITGLTVTTGTDVAADTDKTQFSINLTGLPTTTGRIFGYAAVEAGSNFMITAVAVGTGSVATLQWDSAESAAALTLSNVVIEYIIE